MTKKKKRRRMLIAVAVLLLLVVIYIFVSMADFNAEVAETVEETPVLYVDTDDVASAVVENSYGTFSFSYDGETWTSDDDEEIELDQDALGTLWNRLNPISAVRDLGEITENLDDYGLEEPAVTITVTYEDGTVVSVYLGNETSDDNLYFMTSESDNIYTGDSYLVSAFTFELEDIEEEEEEEEEDTDEEESEEESEEDTDGTEDEDDAGENEEEE